MTCQFLHVMKMIIDQGLQSLQCNALLCNIKRIVLLGICSDPISLDLETSKKGHRAWHLYARAAQEARASEICSASFIYKPIGPPPSAPLWPPPRPPPPSLANMPIWAKTAILLGN